MQAMLFEFLRRGQLDAEPRARAQRCCASAATRCWPRSTSTSARAAPRGAGPDGGYFVWLDLPDGVDASAVFDRAAEAGVAVVKGTDFFPRGQGGESSLRLAFSFVSADELAEGIARLARTVPATTPV